jgi:23S rRNA (uracil1939-C5)-methyltransferase
MTTPMTATIRELAPGGEGVALMDVGGERRAVFVRGVAPGEEVRLDVDLSTRPARGRLLEVMTASPERVVPPCEVVARCGGCDWMHLSASAQKRGHADIVRGLLPEAWRSFDITSHDAPAAFAYRARTRLHVSATGGRATVGFHEARTREPVRVERCVVLTPAIDRARVELEAIFEGAHGRGDVTIALGAFDARSPVVDVHWGGELAPAVFGRLERAVASGAWGGARITCGEATRAGTIGDATPWTLGGDGAPLKLAAAGFSQASEGANALLARRVAELSKSALPEGAEGGRKLVELYAGAGNFTVLLARIGADVLSVEADADACAAARENLSVRSLSARVVCADASTYAWPPTTRILVLDPPRTGARAVATALAARPTRHVIYVSCDPPTLGRDLAPLAAAGYVPRAIETFEMFPQTSHVEVVVALERAKRSAK